MKRSLQLVLALFLATLPALAQNWTQVRTPHLVVITDSGLGSGRSVAVRFELMRTIFGELLQRPELRPGLSPRVIALRGGIRSALPPSKANATGAYVRGPYTDYALVDLSAPDPYADITADYSRALIAANTPPMPLWYDEGLATYFSTVTFNSKEAQLGRRPAFADASLAGHKLIPATTFLAATPASPEFKQSTALYRAQAWLLVSALIAEHKFAAAGEYARLITIEHLAPAEAFERAFGIAPAALDQHLQRTASAKPSLTSVPIPAGFDTASTYTYHDEKLTASDPEAAIAEFHVYSPETFDRGVTELSNLLARDPDNAAARRDLGYAELQRNDLVKAAGDLEKAAELAPKDARVHYYAAMLLSRRVEVMEGNLENARIAGHLQRAVDLDPTYADAWYHLGLAHETDEKFTDASRALLSAIPLAPRNDHYRLALARIYGESNRWSDANALLAYLKGSPDPEVARQVPELSAQLERIRTTPKRTGRFNERARPSSYDAPQWRPKPGSELAKDNASLGSDTKAPHGKDDGKDDAKKAEKAGKPAAPDPRPIVFSKGRLVSAACRADNSATVSVAIGKKTLQLSTRDHRKLVVIGADAFSCSWKDVSVAVNYRASSPTAGDLVSLELQ